MFPGHRERPPVERRLGLSVIFLIGFCWFSIPLDEVGSSPFTGDAHR